MAKHMCVLSPFSGLYPPSFSCPWDFPGKNTGVACHALLQGNLPHPIIKATSLVSPVLAGEFFIINAN